MQFPKKVPMTAVKKKKVFWQKSLMSCHLQSNNHNLFHKFEPVFLITLNKLHYSPNTVWFAKSSGKKTMLKIEIPYMTELIKDCGGQ